METTILLQSKALYILRCHVSCVKAEAAWLHYQVEYQDQRGQCTDLLGIY